MPATVFVVHNRFEKLAAQLQAEAIDIVEVTSNDIAEEMKSTTSTRIARSVTIRRRNSGKSATVTAGDRGRAMHAGFFEFGTVDMAGRPFVTPAAENARPEFMRKMRKLLDLGI